MREGYCTVCTGHCTWSVHKNTPYIYRYSIIEVIKSCKDMESDYDKSMGKPLDFNDYLEYLNTEIQALLEGLRNKFQEKKDCKILLNDIKKNPLIGSTDDKIDRMIKAENLRQDRGYKRRIEMVHELKKYNNIIIIRYETQNKTKKN